MADGLSTGHSRRCSAPFLFSDVSLFAKKRGSTFSHRESINSKDSAPSSRKFWFLNFFEKFLETIELSWSFLKCHTGKNFIHFLFKVKTELNMICFRNEISSKRFPQNNTDRFGLQWIFLIQELLKICVFVHWRPAQYVIYACLLVAMYYILLLNFLCSPNINNVATKLLYLVVLYIKLLTSVEQSPSREKKKDLSWRRF